MAQKKGVEAEANNRCIWKEQELSADPVFVGENSRKLTQKSEKNRNYSRSPTLGSPSPGPRQPELLPFTNTGMYR